MLHLDREKKKKSRETQRHSRRPSHSLPLHCSNAGIAHSGAINNAQKYEFPQMKRATLNRHKRKRNGTFRPHRKHRTATRDQSACTIATADETRSRLIQCPGRHISDQNDMPRTSCPDECNAHARKWKKTTSRMRILRKKQSAVKPNQTRSSQAVRPYKH